MDSKISKNIDVWKKHLLDLGMRNQLLNFREPKMSSLYITAPSSSELYKRLVVDELVLRFPNYDRSIQAIRREARSSRSQQADNPFSYYEDIESVQENLFDGPDSLTEDYEKVIPGDIETSKKVKDLQPILKNLTKKAKSSYEEQGINILYLSFGFLEWTDTKHDENKIKSPLILVPVVLKQEDLISPYTINIHEDEIVSNPTLAFKLENDYGIVMPAFDPTKDSIAEYFSAVTLTVKSLGWTVTDRVALSLLSFLKINMYKEMEDRAETIGENAIVKALCGVESVVNDVPDMRNYDHDTKENPMEIYQVMDADSSQMDAIELSKRGVSFVLQGPPGTGKSQTITNIIAEAMAAGKKVLFVSEKMAALEVVYKRLEAAGLSDFCLVLHSYKANKKEVLNSLNKTLQLKYLPSMKASQDDLNSLRKLADRRQKLNDYCNQLHKIIQPLNQSAFDANGIIAELDSIPYVNVDLSKINIGRITSDQLFALRDAIHVYVTALKKLPETVEDNTWKNCSIRRVSFALSHDIKANFDRFAERTEILNEGIEAYAADLNLTDNITLDNIEDYCKMLEFCSNLSEFPQVWFDGMPNDLLSTAKARRDNEEQHQILRAKIDRAYEQEFYNLKCESTQNVLNDNFSELRRILNDSYESTALLVSNSAEILDCFSKAATYASPLVESFSEISKQFDSYKGKAISEILPFCAFLNAYSTDFKADEYWFSFGKWTQKAFDTNYDIAVEYSIKAKKAREKLLSVYDKDILTFDYKPVLKRYLSEYTSIWTRLFSSGYKSDSKTLRYMQTDCNVKLHYEQVLENLKVLQEYSEAVENLDERDRELKRVLGRGYIGIDSEFEAIKNAAEKFRSIVAYLKGKITSQVRKEILSDENVGKYTDVAKQFERIPAASELLAVNDIISYEPVTFNEYILLNNTVSEAYKTIFSELDKIAATARPETDKANYYEGIKDLCEYNKQSEKLIRTYSECRQKLGNVVNADETDWDTVLQQLNLYAELKQYAGLYGLSRKYLTAIATQKNARLLSSEYADFLKGAYNGIVSDVEWIENLFNTSENIRSKTIGDLRNFVVRCRNNIAGLERWIDYCNAKDACEKVGLSAFIKQSLTENMTPDVIEGVFVKRFEHLWLDAIMPQIPAVEEFRSSNQNQLIEEFRCLDKLQIDINKVRIRQQLISKLPDLAAFTSGKDEVGVLRKELEKQRKIMPIRKLFASIPNLLPCLKPCLMMSPLSVSLFLQDQNYKFDMVIFDEASQVQTENAIGAISRGAQVIIAGDIHQLPPTSFFTATVSGDDEYNEDDETDTDSFESVLSEARTVLPEQPLMWHYRSKNENLIAFSNYKIYDKRLITFPSPVEDNNAEGVEYIYVEDGLYDRGGKRNNIIEAKKVVDVIFQELDNHPMRSLGVITFSESQMNCVENELIRRRLEQPEYESFFAEDKEEAFFIKNLENVQGDERDTIIFSIGYAKSNPLQALPMSFGPLSKQGGYRRLNVAITRSKYAVKLVGSILPTDMNVTDDTPQGVRLLRDYIDFAMHGPTVLVNELNYTDAVNTESPFEDAVYDFLTSKGYSVATQVGCSGYRIDMAVRHPQLHGKFVIGVECDGAMYHSSRTARERDRLRQAVLESMGWKFVRIWSTDWIKDPISEGRRVVVAIKAAIRDYGQEIQTSTESEPQVGEVVLPETNSIFEDRRFRRYEKVMVPHRYYPEALPRIAEMINKIIKVQGPIHIDDLYKQIAPMFATDAAIARVKEGTDRILRVYSEKFGWAYNYPFVSDIGQTEIVPMVSVEKIRTMDHISPREISVAMQVVLEKSFGIDRTGLYSSTSHLFGYQSLSVRVRQAMDDAYDILNGQGIVLEDENGKIILKN